VVVFSDAPSYMLMRPGFIRYANWEDDTLTTALDRIAELEPPMESLVYDELRVKVDVDGCLPRRTYPDDAGLDLIVSEDTYIPLGEFRDVPCGVSVELPEWTWALVTGRSSAFRKRGLLVLPGIIDTGYRGPIFAGVWAQRTGVTVKKGERIAQMIVQSNTTRRLAPIAVPKLNPSPRGTDGFGSTGA
jgi:deoxyuridine 5'-triphosphate nucleotidohydrolase